MCSSAQFLHSCSVDESKQPIKESIGFDSNARVKDKEHAPQARVPADTATTKKGMQQGRIHEIIHSTQTEYQMTKQSTVPGLLCSDAIGNDVCKHALHRSSNTSIHIRRRLVRQKRPSGLPQVKASREPFHTPYTHDAETRKTCHQGKAKPQQAHIGFSSGAMHWYGTVQQSCKLDASYIFTDNGFPGQQLTGHEVPCFDMTEHSERLSMPHRESRPAGHDIRHWAALAAQAETEHLPAASAGLG
jgi:hypothetical protein